jgi:hypothetical protein
MLLPMIFKGRACSDGHQKRFRAHLRLDSSYFTKVIQEQFSGFLT